MISGPVALPDPPDASVVHVETARQMLDAALAALPADVFIGAAAVADWRVDAVSDQKLKKGARGAPSLSLVENPDILVQIAATSAARPRLVVGFAAETENVIENAKRKLSRKGCDLIVANSVAEGSGVFGGAENEVHIVTASGVSSWPRMSKPEIAYKLIELFAARLRGVQ